MHTVPDQKIDGTPSARTWFAGGERVGYDPKARAIVAAQGAPLKVFVKRKGDLAHAVSFLPGYPDGSFGWAKVRPHLPNATEMPKLFVEYVGMGDSDKPKDYPYSTAELSQWPIPGSGTSITTHFVTRRGNSIRIISSGSIEGRPMSL
jgi:pimeloyl-ACP methyl ester carboxylesterase